MVKLFFVKLKMSKQNQNATIFKVMAQKKLDKNRQQIEGLVAWYISIDGATKRHCMSINVTNDRTFKEVFNFIKYSLFSLLFLMVMEMKKD